MRNRNERLGRLTASLVARRRVHRPRVGADSATLALIAALLFVFPFGPTLAQEAAEGSRPIQETVDVEVLNLEVRVTDRKGEPIRGLRASDFEVLENGEEVTPVNFLEVPGVVASEAPPIRLALYVDDHNLLSANRDQALYELEAELSPLLESWPMEAMVAVYGERLDVVQPFTDNWTDLARALAGLRGVPSVGDDRDAYRRSTQISVTDAFRRSRATDRIDRQNASLGIDALLGEMRSYAKEAHADTEKSLAALGTLVRSLAWLEGDKLVVYLSDGLAERPIGSFIRQAQNLLSGGASSAGDLVETRSGGLAGDGGQRGGGIFSRDATLEFSRLQQEVEPYQSSASLEAVIAEANSYGVTVVAVKPPPGDAEASSRRSEGRGALIEISDLREALHLLGDRTGGFANTSATSLAGLLPEAVAGLHSHHYSLGLSMAGKADGEYTAIEVRVKKRGAETRHRRGYVRKSQQTKISERALAALALGASENPHLLEVHVDEMGVAEDDLVDVVLRVEIPIGRIVLREQGEVHRANARIVVVAMDDGDQLTAAQNLGFPLEVPNEALEEARASHYRAMIRLRLPAGDHRVAIGFWDQSAGSGSVLTDTLTVAAR